MRLFDDDFSIEPTPGQINRTEAQRGQWRRRQRKSRAARKLAARVAAAAPLVTLENEAAAARVLQAERKRETWQDAQWLEYIRATGILWGAVTLNRELAARVFEQIDPEIMGPTHSIVFKAAKRIHERGAHVTRAALEKEVRKSGLILLHPLQWIDSATKSPSFPKIVTEELIDSSAQILRAA